MDFTKYRNLMDRLASEYLPGTDSLIFKGYEPVFRYYNGYSDREAGVKMTGKERFFCYSITKIFTSVAMLQLLEEGKFLLSEKLCKYMPEFDSRITIKQLMTMTAGFNYDRSFGEKFRGTDASTRDVLRELAKQPLDFVPGEGYRYSLGYDVLGGLIEVISGESLAAYMENHIFKPLGMDNTGFEYGNKDEIAAIYRFDQRLKRCERLEKVLSDKFCDGYESGGAGIISTTEDLGRFFPVLTNGGTSEDGVRILSPASIDLMRTNFLNDYQRKVFVELFPEYAGYGYGLGVRTFMDPAANGEPGPVGEFGWAGAAGAYVIMDPVNRLTLVFMTHVIGSVIEARDFEEIIAIRNAFYGAM